MAEAIQSLPKYPSYVLLTLARQSARNAVKRQLRAQGLKPQYMRVSEKLIERQTCTSRLTGGSCWS